MSSYRSELTRLGDMARLYASETPNKIAFVCDGREQTYQQYNAHCNQVANGLTQMGAPAQGRIGYIGKNSDWYFELLLGGAKANQVMVSVNWRLAPPEVAYILQDAEVETLFVDYGFEDMVDGLRTDLPSLKNIIPISQYEHWRDSQSADEPTVDVIPDDICVQLYTSGTTGNPKGVQLAHRNLFGLRRPDIEDESWQRWTEDDVSLVAMPNFHIGGTGWGISGLYVGAKNVVMPEFDPGQVLDFIQTYRISKLFMVPAALQIVVRDPRAKDTDFSCLDCILYGASPIPLDLLKECMTVFGCGFAQMYGMTETTGTIVALPPEDHDPEGGPKMRSAGKALPGIDVQIWDDDGNEVPRGTVGEIVARGPANMKGYWKLPEATANTIDADGWLRTGDAGYMDEDDYVYIHDRVKDMIISGGENIYPAEVESALYGHADIADVAVIGVPDDKWGEAVKACVVVHEGKTLSADDVIAYARTQIAAFKCPKTVDFIPELPRNPSGKILRRELRAPYWAGKDRAVN